MNPYFADPHKGTPDFGKRSYGGLSSLWLVDFEHSAYYSARVGGDGLHIQLKLSEAEIYLEFRI